MKHQIFLVTCLFGGALAVKTIIPKTCFGSQANFDADFNYLYPWGSDHNGGARMDKSKVSINGNMLTLTASPSPNEKPAGHGGRLLPINYRSGTVHAKEQFSVASTGGYDFTADFKATTTRGTWPAFWLTAVHGWPPEIDLAEWKGSGRISFNTYNASTQVTAKDVPYPNPEAWHTCKTELRDLNGQDVGVKFFLDGQLMATQTGRGFVGKPMWMILDLQMEGSSGRPAPMGNTAFQVRNLEVLSYNP